MNIILFIHHDCRTKGEILIDIMAQNCENVGIKAFQTINSFKERLKQISNYNKEVFILLADSENRLDELTTLIDLMENKRIIIILPENTNPIVSKVHQFFPRYFTTISESYTDLCSVITKMSENEKKTIN